MVAAPNGHAIGSPNLSGYVKIFRRTNNGWAVNGPSRLNAPVPQEAALFGAAVDTDGQYVAVGCLNQNSTPEQTPMVGQVYGAGCVYVYKWNLNTESFDLDGQLFAEDASSSLQMGGTVKIAGGKIYASSYSNHKVYCFKRLGANNWVHEFTLQDPEPNNAQPGFASDFSVAGDTVIVSDDIDTRGALTWTGAAFAYTINTADMGNDSCNGAKAVQAGNHYGCTTAATVDGFSNCGQSGENDRRGRLVLMDPRLLGQRDCRHHRLGLRHRAQHPLGLPRARQQPHH